MSNNDLHILAQGIAEKHGITVEDAERFLTQLFDLIAEALVDEKIVKLKGFGTFRVVDVKDRESIDVNTGERIVLEGRNKVTFTPDNLVKELVNKPFSQFESVVLNDGVDFSELDKQQEASVTDAADSSDNDAVDEPSEPQTAPANAVVSDDKDAVQPAEKTEKQDVNAVDETAEDRGEADEKIENSDTSASDNDEGEHQPQADESPKPDVVTVESQPFDNEQHSDDSGSNVDNDGDNVTTDAKQETRHRPSRMYIIIIGVMLSVIMFSVGYLAGSRDVLMIMHRPHAKPSPTAAIQSPAAVSEDTVANKDTVKENAAAVLTAVDTVDITAPRASDSPELAAARTMVRHGAYTIVGTMEVIGVRKGMNLRKISKNYFGDNMECYVQVLNGKMEVNEGEKIKIPLLKAKQSK